MNNAILVNVEHFTVNRDRLFCIRRLRADGINASVWDCSIFSKRGLDFPDIIEADYITKFQSLNEVRKALDRVDIEDTFFIVQVPFHNLSYPFFKELLRRKCYIACFNFYTNVMDVPTYHISLGQYVSRPIEFMRKFRLKVSNYVQWRMYQLRWKNVKYDCYLSPSPYRMRTGGINHPDYNDYYFGEREQVLDYPYLVFCDNYFPYHPDLVAIVDGHEVRTADYIDGLKYQRQMSQLFDELERRYRLPVVVAAHPKAKYAGHEFGNRCIIKYKTNALVSHSEGVVFHTSNSISYAIMANKPIICVTTDDYNSVGSFKAYIEYMCHYFDMPFYNLDENDKSDIVFHSIKEEIRNDYIYSFLTSKESEGIDNYSIIKNTILNTQYHKSRRTASTV